MSVVLAPPAPRRRLLVALAAAAAVAATAGQPAVSALSALRDRLAVGRAAEPAVSPARLDPGLPVADPRPVAVVVQVVPGQLAAVTAAVQAAGGTVGAGLPLVDGFSAKLPGTSLTRIAQLPGVRAVTADTVVRFKAVDYTEAGVASAYAKAAGAPAAWSRGNLGTGVGVAVIDTGISPMRDFEGRLVHGPDLSGEGRTIDSFGHGTVMAGVIGGSGEDSAGNAGGAYAGVAPGATLVGVKVAGRNGAADVSTMLEAMHWVSAYREQFNIRVLNLSWGTNSTADPRIDPLNYAVQRLWRQGIVVVVSAGNSGPAAGSITKPGDDPLAITVGAYDDKGNTSPSDDNMPSWSSRGPTVAGHAKPDLVAPGRTLVSTRSYGSAVENDNPQALVSPSYIKGSGTSQSAAVVSGLAALLVAARPSLTPDQVKSLLTRTASPLAGVEATRQGSGRAQLAAALTADPGPASWQTFSGSGLGSLDASRGTMRVVSDCDNDGTVNSITGEMTVKCQPWDGAAWTGAAWTGAAWTGAAWTGAAWTGAAWTGAAWTGAAWTGAAWTGGEWSGAAWTGAAWTGAAWTGAAWTGAAWTGAVWNGAAWTGAAWTGAAWTGAAWTGASYGSSDELDATQVFQTAFWGKLPRFWQHVPGELSAKPPKALVDKAVAKYGVQVDEPYAMDPHDTGSTGEAVYASSEDGARYPEQTVDLFADELTSYAASTG